MKLRKFALTLFAPPHEAAFAANVPAEVDAFVRILHIVDTALLPVTGAQ